MRMYELIVIVRSSLKEEQRKKFVDSIKTWLKNAKIEKEKDLGQKVLAYPIKREQSGYFFNFAFSIDTIPSDLEKKLLGNESVVRHLLIRTK